MNPNDLPPEDQPRRSDEEIERLREETVEKADEIAEERGEYVRIKLVDADDIYKHYTDVNPRVVANIDEYDSHEMVEETEDVVASEL